jgi:hypothetical protein
MQTAIVEYTTADGKTVYVEVDDESPGMRKAGRGDIPVKAEATLDEALENVMPSADRLLGKLQGLSLMPSGVELELGIKFNVKTGAVIASTALEGNIRVKITWAPRGSSGEGDDEAS